MLNHIELAKECGAQIEDYHNPAGEWLGCDYAMSPSQLAAYTNAVIEQVEKELRSKFVGIADVIDVVRDMKVKG